MRLLDLLSVYIEEFPPSIVGNEKEHVNGILNSYKLSGKYAIDTSVISIRAFFVENENDFQRRQANLTDVKTNRQAVTSPNNYLPHCQHSPAKTTTYRHDGNDRRTTRPGVVDVPNVLSPSDLYARLRRGLKTVTSSSRQAKPMNHFALM